LHSEIRAGQDISVKPPAPYAESATRVIPRAYSVKRGPRL